MVRAVPCRISVAASVASTVLAIVALSSEAWYVFEDYDDIAETRLYTAWFGIDGTVFVMDLPTADSTTTTAGTLPSYSSRWNFWDGRCNGDCSETTMIVLNAYYWGSGCTGAVCRQARFPTSCGDLAGNSVFLSTALSIWIYNTVCPLAATVLTTVVIGIVIRIAAIALVFSTRYTEAVIRHYRLLTGYVTLNALALLCASVSSIVYGGGAISQFPTTECAYAQGCYAGSGFWISIPCIGLDVVSILFGLLSRDSGLPIPPKETELAGITLTIPPPNARIVDLDPKKDDPMKVDHFALPSRPLSFVESTARKTIQPLPSTYNYHHVITPK